MCGIAGYIYKNSDRIVSKENISKMLKAIEHRGPDGFGIYTKKNVSFGMQRLSIIDTIEHTIPYFTYNGQMGIVYNGEVYNHNQIRQNLLNKDKLKYESDAETVLYAIYEKGIHSSCSEFNGMYAFAVYEPAQNKMILVRDKSGEKPLYYYEDNEKFLFASEIKAILTVVEPQYNYDIKSYKAFEICCGKETLFKNIYSIEPGAYIEFSHGHVKAHDYWKVWDHRIEIPDNENKIVNNLTELLEDSILLRKQNSAHEIGCLVSGGVDSALVACIAKPDYIYTGNYDINKSYDELHYAKLVAEQINKELRIIRPTKEDYIKYQDKIIYYLDQPATWTSFNLFMVFKKASEKVKVVMSGEGADELFGGYHRYHLLNHDQKIFELQALNEYHYLINKYYGSLESRYAKLINRNPNQFDDENNKYIENIVKLYFSKVDGIISGMGLTDFFTSMQILLTMADRMSMVFHIENRSPFLDHRLIQYAFSLNDKYKIKDGITKYILKKVAKKIIPGKIVERIDKRGFVAPVNIWFNWSKNGQYDRLGYRKSVFDIWKKIYFGQASLSV